MEITIHSKTIRENVHTLRSRLKTGVKICAVVKANAYSLGDVMVAQTIDDLVDCFAVADLSEAKNLREAGIEKDILLFGVCEDLETAKALGITISVNSLPEAQNVATNVAGLKIHIMVDTGMNRYGINSIHELETILSLLGESVEGIYTHMAYEEENLPKINKQLERFSPFVEAAKRSNPNIIVHAACAGSAHLACAQFDMVRVGKSFYGGYHGYKTAIQMTSKIVAVRKIKAGETVSYNGHFVSTKDMTIGVVLGGYADGVHCGFSSKTFVFVDGKPCPILGRICMDAFMVDVSEIKRPLGKKVTIVDDLPGITIMEHVRRTKVVTCDFLCGVGTSKRFKPNFLP